MAKKTNYTAIGFFVANAIILTILVLFILGSGHLFEKGVFYSLYFDKSVNGLTKGSAVVFRGIKLGEVTDIRLAYVDTEKKSEAINEANCPIRVTVRLYPNALIFDEESDSSSIFSSLTQHAPLMGTNTNFRNWLRHMVTKQGLRAQLQVQNYLTGHLYIECDLFPDAEDTEQAAELIKADIIPTRLSVFERLFQSLGNANFSTKLNSVYDIIDSAAKIIKSEQTKQLLDNLSAASVKINTTLDSIQSLAQNANGLTERAKTVIDHVDSELNDTKTRVNGAIDTIQTTAQKADTALSGIQSVTQDAHTLLAPESPTLEEFVRTMREIRQASEMLRQVLTLLGDKPESLVWGK